MIPTMRSNPDSRGTIKRPVSQYFGQGKRTILRILPIVFISLVVFSTKIHGQFLSDDFAFLLRAERFSFSVENLLRAGLYGQWYRPVPVTLWMILYRFFDLHAVWYHLAILAIHVSNALLFYAIAVSLFDRNVALISASVFAIFTGHMEAIHWLSCFFDVVCAFFFLSSILGLVRFVQTQKYPYYILSLVLAACALLSKENAVMLPFVCVTLIFCWPFLKGEKPGSPIRSVGSALPYLLLLGGYLLVRVCALEEFHVKTPEVASLVNWQWLAGYPGLLADFLVPAYKSERVLMLSYLVVEVFAIAILIFMIYRKDSRKPIIAGLIWIFITAFLTVKMRGATFFASRWNYLPAVGFCLLWGAICSGVPRRLAKPFSVAIIALYALSTVYHNGYWLKAWSLSERVQTAFKTEIQPFLAAPANAYFFHVPETHARIHVFFTGLPQCFSLLSGDERNNFYLARTIVPPHVGSPERLKQTNTPRNYYLYDWIPSDERFQLVEPVLRETGKNVSEDDALASWNFNEYKDFSQWEPAWELRLIYDKTTRKYKYVTTGASSILISPPINKRVKYVRLVFRSIQRGGRAVRGQLLWVTNREPFYDGKKSITFSVKKDAELQKYLIPLFINGWSVREPIHRLGLRMSNQSDTVIDIKSITLYPYLGSIQPHPYHQPHGDAQADEDRAHHDAHGDVVFLELVAGVERRHFIEKHITD